MRRHLTLILLASTFTTAAAAQATGLPTFNAPYRAFRTSEIGILVTFPAGGGTAFQGAYRRASGRFDVGFLGGIYDPDGPGDATLLVGVEARQRVLTHGAEFPLDGAVVVGIGGAFGSGNSVLFVPVGLSLGRRLTMQGSAVSIIPYVQPTLLLEVNGGSDVRFGLGLGADFRLTPRFDARIAAGLGDIEGVTIGAVWIH